MTSRATILILFFMVTMSHTINSQEQIKYSVLGIEYIGESDKPITPIVISDSRAGTEWYRQAVLKRDESELIYRHVVSTSLLETLVAKVYALRGAAQQKREKKATPYKAVVVTVVTPRSSNTFHYDMDSAISLLNNLQKSCERNQSLRSDLGHFRDRIDQWK